MNPILLIPARRELGQKSVVASASVVPRFPSGRATH
jgi:hypothetical protein